MSRSSAASTAGAPGLVHRVDAGRRRVSVTARDHVVLGSVLELGAVSTETLRALHAPGLAAATFRRRLRVLHAAGLLRPHPSAGLTSGGQALHQIGPAALTPGQDRPWAPSVNQTAHTLTVGTVLVGLLALPVGFDGWRGEGSVRAWEQPADPRPDLRIHLPEPVRWLDVEVDLGTEGLTVWRRKLARYATFSARRYRRTLLVTTTSMTRAMHISIAARKAGVRLIATTTGLRDPDVQAYDWTAGPPTPLHLTIRRLVDLATAEQR